MTSARFLRPFLPAACLAAFALLAGPVATAAQAGTITLAQQDTDEDAGGQPDQVPDASALLLRVSRLETQIRGLRGRVEELQHQNEQLQDTLRKLAQDVEFRFQDLQGQGRGCAPVPGRPAAQKRGDIDPGTPDPATPAVAAVIVPPTLPRAEPGGYTPLKPTMTDDAFDPLANPAAPGAPRPLGTTPPSAPLAPVRTASAPLDLLRPGTVAAPAPAGDDPDTGPTVVAAPSGVRPFPGPNAVASLAPGGTRDEFEVSLGSYKQGQYDAAATGLQSFVQKYPRDRLVPDAVYLMGESYSRLGRHREAAEQFLKLSTDYPRAPRAPDALLKLGMSLGALGAKDQACATYQEVARKYPAATPEVKTGVDREIRRAHCAANG